MYFFFIRSGYNVNIARIDVDTDKSTIQKAWSNKTKAITWKLFCLEIDEDSNERPIT